MCSSIFRPTITPKLVPHVSRVPVQLQVIACIDLSKNDLLRVERDVKLYSVTLQLPVDNRGNNGQIQEEGNIYILI